MVKYFYRPSAALIPILLALLALASNEVESKTGGGSLWQRGLQFLGLGANDEDIKAGVHIPREPEDKKETMDHMPLWGVWLPATR